MGLGVPMGPLGSFKDSWNIMEKMSLFIESGLAANCWRFRCHKHWNNILGRFGPTPFYFSNLANTPKRVPNSFSSRSSLFVLFLDRTQQRSARNRRELLKSPTNTKDLLLHSIFQTDDSSSSSKWFIEHKALVRPWPGHGQARAEHLIWELIKLPAFFLSPRREHPKLPITHAKTINESGMLMGDLLTFG